MQWSISETWWMLVASKPLPLCSAPPVNLLVGITGVLGMKESALSQLNHVLRKCSRVSQKQWMPELSHLCHCIQHSWKITSRDFWSSMNERKPLSKLKDVFWENSCGVSQTQWKPKLSDLWHCVLHPWKITSRDFWSSRTIRESCFLSKNVFWENAVGYLRNSECYSFQTFAIMFCTPDTILVRDFWSSRNKRKSLSWVNHDLRKCSGVSSEMVNASASKALPLCSAPLKTY